MSRLARQSALTLGCLAVGVAWAAHGLAADWLQFRGPAGKGQATGANLPTSWSLETGENVAWSAELPGRGPSSPIVVNGRVIVTCSDGPKQDRLHVLAFDEVSGKSLWHRQFWATGRTQCNPVTANAAPSPASDGQRIVALFSSCDLVCLDLDGNLLWYRALAIDYPKAGNDVGMSSSPMFAGDTVVVQIECQGDSFVEGLDKDSGDTRWHLLREQVANWCSPTALVGPAGTANRLVLQSPQEIALYDPENGVAVWRYRIKCEAIPSACSADDLLIVPSEGLTALQWNPQSESAEVVWRESGLRPGAASPIVQGDRVYVINRIGVLCCGDLASGEILWRKRLGGAYWATPVAVGKHLYAANDDGRVVVVSLAEEGKIVAKNTFSEKLQASPAVTSHAIYFRSDRHLWKISARSAR